MEQVNEIVEKLQMAISENAEIQKINLPALREVVGHVVSSMKNDLSYTKHSDHSKSSTKGCPMGCLGG